MPQVRSRLGDSVGRSKVVGVKRRSLHILRRFVRISNSKNLGLLARVSLRAMAKFTGRPPTGLHRSLASVAQPLDPLRAERSLPHIDIAVPFVEKDINSLELLLANLKAAVANPISRIQLVTPAVPAGSVPRFEDPQSLAKIHRLIDGVDGVTLVFDHEVLGANLSNSFAALPKKIDGYRVQQVLKFCLAMQSVSTATLVVDADTVLLHRKVWLANGGIQLLQFSEEYHQPYRNLLLSHFGIQPLLPVSFITHHQLMQREIVNEIFPTEGALVDWYLASLEPGGGKMSEYETYGHYLTTRHPNRVAYGNWANLWSPHLDIVLDSLNLTGQPLPVLLGDYNTVSFHSHSQK